MNKFERHFFSLRLMSPRKGVKPSNSKFNAFIALSVAIFLFLSVVISNLFINYLTVLTLDSNSVYNDEREFFSQNELKKIPCFTDAINLENSRINYSLVADFKKCTSEPHYHIGFVKTHKCASDTVAGLFLRIADEQNLQVILPAQIESWNIGWPRPIGRDFFLPSLKKSKRYDMQALHHMYSPNLWDELLEPDRHLIGIIRNPLDQFISVFNYFRIGTRIVKDFHSKNETVFDDFLQNPQVYYEYFAPQNIMFQNPMLLDFGYTKEMKKPLEDFIQFIRKKFSLILVADFLDESLILLKRKLCWTMRDVLFMSKNKSQYKNLVLDKSSEDMQKQREKLYRKWSSEDYVFYETLLKVFWKRVAVQSYFYEEVKTYKRIREIVLNYCKKPKGKSSVDKIDLRY